ncbi:MAG: glycerol-3-phosphate 1-O-acyltransferase PlsY [Ostreibacterium sp.]
MTGFMFFLIIGYLFGSLSSAVIVCNVMRLPDPRTQGSNNPGATNVMRIGGKKAAYLTFAGDFLKGLLPVLLAKLMTDNYGAITGAALGAFLGHLYPLYFNFKGGKGVATFVGVLLGLNAFIFFGFLVIWLTILLTTGYVSLASMIGALTTIIMALFLSSSAIVFLLVILAGLMIYRHRDNIQKLKNGTENHFRKKKKEK